MRTVLFNFLLGSLGLLVSSCAAQIGTNTVAAAQNTILPSIGASPITNDFGTCTVPMIQFSLSSDGRRQPTFSPVNTGSFRVGFSTNINVVANAICQQLRVVCGADATALMTCSIATRAANGAPKGTGMQADVFNAAFGIPTSFGTVVSQAGGRINKGHTGVAGAGFGIPIATPVFPAKDPAATVAPAEALGDSESSTETTTTVIPSMISASLRTYQTLASPACLVIVTLLSSILL